MEHALDQPLPADVLAAGGASWARYRQYPVFSLPWLRGRSVLFAGFITLYGLLSALGLWLSSAGAGIAALSAVYFVAAFMIMATAGPALATWVRYRRWPLGRERVLVVAAMFAGIAASYAADDWASRYLSQVALPAAGMKGPDARPRTPAGVVLNLAWLAAIYGIFGGGLALRAYFSERQRFRTSEERRQRRELELQKRESDTRLAILQAQVEPHFLFNSLASIRSLIGREPGRAEVALDALVDYLRATIPTLRDRAAATTLGQQMDLCVSYLALMQVRMGDRLAVEPDVPESLRAHPFPPLILIGLVENAIKHGIEPRPGSGRVAIRARADAGALVVQVEDDGAGLHPGAGGGLGLENVRAQLATRYGAAARFSLASRPGGGAVAEIRVPMERAV
jgi:signal transduction histidine kinase